jgi:CheY-like chemotaxis protein
VLQLLCRRAGYAVTAYTHGYDLLKNEWETPDIFLIDRQLSGIDGLDLCRHLKAQAITRHIPVIILSASPHVHLPAIEAGADVFIEKPFSNKELMNTIEQLVS